MVAEMDQPTQAEQQQQQKPQRVLHVIE